MIPAQEKDRDDWDWLAWGYGVTPKQIIAFVDIYALKLDPYIAAVQTGIPAYHISRLVEEEPIKEVYQKRLEFLNEFSARLNSDTIRGLAVLKARKFNEFNELIQNRDKEGAKVWLKDLLESL